MLVTDQKTLCFKCHADQAKEAATAKSLHGAFGKGDCSKCHDPHKAKLKKLLLAGSPDLCTSCHKELKARMATDKVHSPAEDCLGCHAPHASPEPSLTLQPVTSLCAECHETKEPAFKKAHLAIDPGALHCMSCHDPHASKDPKFFKASMHPPFVARDCGTCHVEPK
jgi:predicted CXXCH cytochrome family protein